MASANRKEALRQYKEKKTERGVYGIRCPAAQQVWVGASMNLAAAKNGAWFGLRNGSHIHKGLQKEWQRHGADAFEYQILEVLDEKVDALLVKDALAQMKSRWMVELSAHALL